MTTITNKLEKVHADLWVSHNLFFQSGNTYTAIFICKHNKKTWISYLWGKDKFVNIF